MGAHRPQKRRKLSGSAPELQLQTPQMSHPPKVVAIHTIPPTCVTCHRALSTAPGTLIVCARCASPVCAICSRTCTASPTSMPPTPYLTRSPTPTPPPSPPRSALSINSWNTNLADPTRGVNPGNAGIKRRKAVDEDSPDAMEQALGAFDLMQGCGRTVCRNCSIENVESDSTTCHDCLSH